MNSKRFRLAAVSLSAVMFATSSVAASDDMAINLLNLLVQQGVITRDKADALIKQSQQPADSKPATPGPAPTAAPAGAAPAAAVAPATAPAGAQSGSATPSAASSSSAASAPAPAPAGVQSGSMAPAAAASAPAAVRSAAANAAPAAAPAQSAAPSKDTAGSSTATTTPVATPATLAAGSQQAGAASTTTPDAPETVHVQYVPEFVKEQIRNEIKQEVLDQAHNEKWGDPGAMPEWLGRIVWGGDVRMRQETDLFPSSGGEPNLAPYHLSGAPFAYPLEDTTETRNRLRLRARFGLQARISDEFTAGLRVASGVAGGSGNPTTENSTLGNYDERTSIGLDRAYIRYKPTSWLTLTGGRFANPFFAPTELVWADALSPDGVVMKLTHDFSDSFDTILVAGAFPIQLQDNQSQSSNVLANPDSKWMFGYQTGFDWQVADRDDWKLTAALFDYRHVEGILDTNSFSHPADATDDWSAAGFRQMGNQVFDIHGDATGTTPLYGLLSKFRELNFSTRVDLANFAPLHILFDADWVKNLAFHQQEIENRTGVTPTAFSGYDALINRTIGYMAKITVGDAKLRERWDWQAFLGYKDVERDAVMDAFTDGDFHLGGTNAKGYFVGGKLGVASDTYVSVRWLSADTIDLPGPLNIDMLQVDLNTSF